MKLSNSSGSYTGDFGTDGGIGDASTFYNSWSGYQDELIWGAAWVAKATGSSSDLARGKYRNNRLQSDSQDMRYVLSQNFSAFY